MLDATEAAEAAEAPTETAPAAPVRRSRPPPGAPLSGGSDLFAKAAADIAAEKEQANAQNVTPVEAPAESIPNTPAPDAATQPMVQDAGQAERPTGDLALEGDVLPKTQSSADQSVKEDVVEGQDLEGQNLEGQNLEGQDLEGRALEGEAGKTPVSAGQSTAQDSLAGKGDAAEFGAVSAGPATGGTATGGPATSASAGPSSSGRSQSGSYNDPVGPSLPLSIDHAATHNAFTISDSQFVANPNQKLNPPRNPPADPNAGAGNRPGGGGGFAPFAGLGGLLSTVTAPIGGAVSAAVAAQRALGHSLARDSAARQLVSHVNMSMTASAADMKKNHEFLRRAMVGLPADRFEDLYMTTPSVREACDANRAHMSSIRRGLADVVNASVDSPVARQALKNVFEPKLREINESVKDSPDATFAKEMKDMVEALVEAIRKIFARLTGRGPRP